MATWQAIGKSDEWYTPKYIFDALNVQFDMDVAAPVNGPLHVPTSRWLSSGSLVRPWEGFIWMNPPFGGRNGILPWLEKFFAHGNGVALTPDRTSAPWWQFAAERADGVLFMSPKVKFIRPDGSVGEQPGNGTCLWAAGEKAADTLCGAIFLGQYMQRA